MIYSGRTPYGTNQVQSSSLAITVENTDVAVFTTGSLLVSGSLTSLGGFTGSFSGSFTGSANLTTLTSSNALVTGNVIVLGTASINTLVVNQTQLSTGSNQLGDNVDDFQTLFGTVRIPTGSFTVTGSTIISSSAATQLQVGSNLLFVSSSGQVGIGSTTFPSVGGVAKLYVEGTGSGVSGRTYFIVKNTNASSAAAFSLINASGKILGAQINSAGWPGGEAGGFSTEYGLNMSFTTDGHLASGGTSTIGFYVGGYSVSPTMTITAGNTGNVLIGTTTNAGFKLDVSGSGRFSSNLTITGSATNSLLVKGSGATSATTTLRVENSSASPSLTVLDNGFVGIGVASPNFRLDVSGSSEFIGNIQVTGSTFISASASTSSAALQVYKSGSTVLNVEGSSGQLFSITDSLTGSLFSVNTVAGLSVIEAFSDNTVNIGKFGVYPIKVAATGTLAVITGSFTGSFTGSVLGTSSFALTASFVNPLTQSVLIRGLGTTSATTALSVQNSNASSSLVVLDNGYVGIGTSTPDRLLTVFANANDITSAFFGVRNPNTGTGAGSGFSLGEDFANFKKGTIYYLNSGWTASGTNLPNSMVIVTDGSVTNGLVLRTDANAPIKFATSGSTNERMRITGNGLIGIGTTSPSASFHVVGNTLLSGSAGTGSALTVYKSGSTVVSIQGSQGELFSITDSLSGSLFSVSNISGLPILEVFSDNTTLVGNYLDPMLVTTQLVTANSGSTTIYSLPTASYDGAFYDYVVRSGSNARAGQIMAIWSGSSVNYTDNSTTDFGSTANLSFNVIVSGSNMVLRSTVTTGSWTVKTIIRSI